MKIIANVNLLRETLTKKKKKVASRLYAQMIKLLRAIFHACIYRDVCRNNVNSSDDSVRITRRQITVNYLHRRASRKALLFV